MTWTDIRTNHPDILDRLKRDFPYLRDYTVIPSRALSTLPLMF